MLRRWVCILFIALVNTSCVTTVNNTHYKVKPSVTLSPLQDLQGNYYISYMYIGLKLEECFMPECNDDFTDEMKKIWKVLTEDPPDEKGFRIQYWTDEEHEHD
jgi:hypothetical protein